MVQKLENKTLNALTKFYNTINDKKISWVLSGSTSLFIQGVDVKINNDIDILTDKKGAYQIDKLLSEYRTKKMEYTISEKYKSHYGTYKIDGVNLDVMGEFQYLTKNGSWSQPNHKNNVKMINFKNMDLPLLSLEQELEEYIAMGRIDKVDKIRKTLNHKSCNI